MKYTRLRQLPFRVRLTITLLYLTALGLITAASWIAADRNFTIGVAFALTLETIMIINLLRIT